MLKVRAGKTWNSTAHAYLLAQTDSRACVEGNEDERVGCEILLDPGVNETARIKLES